MADSPISTLTAATTPLAGTEELAIVQSSTTKKVAASALPNLSNADLTADQAERKYTLNGNAGSDKLTIERNNGTDIVQFKGDGTILLGTGKIRQGAAGTYEWTLGGNSATDIFQIESFAGTTIAEFKGDGTVEVGGNAVVTSNQILFDRQIACSDLTSDLTTGTSKAYFRATTAFTLTEVRASVLTAPTGSAITVDINKNGTTMLSTKLTIDATEKTSTTAATPAVISVSSVADDDEITIDVNGVGSTIAGAGLIVTLIYDVA